MSYVYKYFFILVSPLLLSYLIPIIIYQNYCIGIFSIGEQQSILYIYFNNFDITKSFALVFLWIFVCLLIIRIVLCIEKNSININNKTAKILNNLNYKKLFNIFIVLFIVGNSIAIIHNFYIFPGSIEELVHQLSLMPILIVGLGFFIIYEEKISKKQSIIIYILILMSIANGLSLYLITSRAAYVLYFMISVALILDYYSRNNKLKIIFIVIIISSIPFLMAFKVYIRNNFYENGITRINVMEFQNNKILFTKANSPNKKDLKSEILEFYVFDEGNTNNVRFQFLKEDSYLSYVIRRAAARVNHLGITNYYYSIFPDDYPYLGSAYLKKLFLGIVPRIAWADKPRSDLANTLPILTKLLPPYDRTTSYNLNIVEEGLAFQGVLGLLVVAVVYGLIIVLTFIAANFYKRLSFILMPLCAFTLLNTESGLYGIFNGTLHTIFVYFLILSLIKISVKNN